MTWDAKAEIDETKLLCDDRPDIRSRCAMLLVRRAYDAGSAAARERTEALGWVVAAARPLRARFDETEATFEAAYYGLKRDWRIWGTLRAALDREA